MFFRLLTLPKLHIYRHSWRSAHRLSMKLLIQLRFAILFQLKRYIWILKCVSRNWARERNFILVFQDNSQRQNTNGFLFPLDTPSPIEMPWWQHEAAVFPQPPLKAPESHRAAPFEVLVHFSDLPSVSAWKLRCKLRCQGSVLSPRHSHQSTWMRTDWQFLVVLGGGHS